MKLVLLYGVQGVGKSYLLKNLPPIINNYYVETFSTDYAEKNKEFLKLSVDERQKKFINNTYTKIKTNLKRIIDTQNSNNLIVVDFGIEQIKPYLDYLEKELNPETFKYYEKKLNNLNKFITEKFDEIYKICFFKNEEDIEKQIKSRNRSNYKWELDTFKEINTYFKKLAKDNEFYILNLINNLYKNINNFKKIVNLKD